MDTLTLTPPTSLKELVSRHPETIPVFLRHRMACVGCFMSGFDTLEEAVANYALSWEAFTVELQAAIEGHHGEND